MEGIFTVEEESDFSFTAEFFISVHFHVCDI